MDTSTINASGALRGDRDGEGLAVPGVLLLFSAGTARSRALPLDGGELLIGRADTASGQVQDGRVSRQHARVQFDGRRFRVTDLGSQNGTWADGERVMPNAPREVDRVIRVGDSLLVVLRDVRPFERLGVKTIAVFVRGPASQAVLDETARAAQLGFTLHIRGESGTGKEGVARAFHESGPRAGGPFIAVNCAAIPQSVAERLLFGAKKGAFSGADADAPGYLQEADGGTLFLDEIGDMSLIAQAKFLRVLEERRFERLGGQKSIGVDFRLISATNRPLEQFVRDGRFREDLYYRVNAFAIRLPSLRERPVDIPVLAQRFLARYCASQGLPPDGKTFTREALDALTAYPWPGNIRELESTVSRAALSAPGRAIRPQDVEFLQPFSTPQPAEPDRLPSLAEAERAHISRVLDAVQWNKKEAARVLDISRGTLYRKIAEYSLDPAAQSTPSPNAD